MKMLIGDSWVDQDCITLLHEMSTDGRKLSCPSLECTGLSINVEVGLGDLVLKF